MSFEYNYGCADVAKSLNGNIKFGSGVWKTTKQRKFMFEKLLPAADFSYPRDKENSLNYFGVEIDESQMGLVLEGSVRWADYGSKSFRRCGWFYVLDEIGVVSQYKLHYTYDAGASSVNKKRTELLWSRPENVQAPIEPIPEIKPELEYIGTIGDRVTMRLVQTYFINKGPSRFSYYGSELFTIFKDEKGNIVYYNNFPAGVSQEDAQEGIEVTFTVKKHSENKNGQKVTLATRMVLSKGQKLLQQLKA